MEDGRSIIDDVRMWANEYHLGTPSRAARDAASNLAEVHRDLPEIVGLSADILRKVGIDAASSRTTSRRLADAVVRETAHAGSDEISGPDRLDIVRRSLRNVFVQEAAGHEIERRGGVDPSRALDKDPDRAGHGAIATDTLRRVGVDVDDLYSSMTEHDLARTSQGAYDRVSVIAHEPLHRAIEANGEIMTRTQRTLNDDITPRPREESRRPRPAVSPLRHLAPAAVAARPSFGRRMAHVQAMAAGAGR